jgi:hypothetical protein
MTQTNRDKNLLVVCAVEGYARRHNMTTYGAEDYSKARRA